MKNPWLSLPSSAETCAQRRNNAKRKIGKRKLTEEERKYIDAQINLCRLAQAERSVKQVWGIRPWNTKAGGTPKYIVHEIFHSHAGRIHLCVEPTEQCDELDIEIFELLLRNKGRISIAQIISWLPVSIAGYDSDKKFKDKVKKRVKRLRQINPPEFFRREF
jgi:hypothetical protein